MEIAEQRHLVDVLSGEALPATTENAHRVLTVGRDLKRRIDDEIGAATDFLLEQSRREGTKTFHTAAGDVSLSGGPTVEYDAHTLEELLREAGCPEDRIRAVVKEEITYKVDRAVLRQLVAANPDYAAAADLAKRDIEKPWRATAK
jgi:hypothetical protein